MINSDGRLRTFGHEITHIYFTRLSVVAHVRKQERNETKQEKKKRLVTVARANLSTSPREESGKKATKFISKQSCKSFTHAHKI